MKKNIVLLAVAALVLALAPTAQAALITGVTATARSEFYGHATWHHQIEEAVNGDGMVSGEGATGLHTVGVGQNHGVGWQVAQAGNIAHWIKVDLGAIYDVGNMYVWNGLKGLWERGMKTADIYYSTTDPGNNTHVSEAAFDDTGWTLLTSGQAFAQTDNPTNADFLPSDTIALDVKARYIVLNITEAYGGINNVSISELQFSEASGTTPAADPEITSITSLDSGNWELKLKGKPDTAYEFYSSTDLDFDTGTQVTGLTAGVPAVGTITGTTLTTDDDGDATVRMFLGDLGAVPANFVRAVGP